MLFLMIYYVTPWIYTPWIVSRKLTINYNQYWGFKKFQKIFTAPNLFILCYIFWKNYRLDHIIISIVLFLYFMILFIFRYNIIIHRKMWDTLLPLLIGSTFVTIGTIGLTPILSAEAHEMLVSIRFNYIYTITTMKFNIFTVFRFLLLNW